PWRATASCTWASRNVRGRSRWLASCLRTSSARYCAASCASRRLHSTATVTSRRDCSRALVVLSFPSSAWERRAAKLCFASQHREAGRSNREAELRDVRSQAELGNETPLALRPHLVESKSREELSCSTSLFSKASERPSPRLMAPWPPCPPRILAASPPLP